VLVDGANDPNEMNGSLLANLCLANKTPALLVPGGPPGLRDEEREREYAKHGIERVITGDVYYGDFEAFREKFNNTIVEKLEAERGDGYVVRLSNEIERRVKARYP
jgi:phosphoribosylformimino-5-aminoimidazole carboxamide ribonucleotide (ProFAR) isomerase